MISTAIKQPIRFILQHSMNSLHIYSLLCRLNINEEKALSTVKVYEKIVHPLLYIKKERNN